MTSSISVYEMWPVVGWNDQGHSSQIHGERVLQVVCG